MKLELRPPPLRYHTDDGRWHLLRDGDGELYLLVECEASFVSYPCLVRLNDDEQRDLIGLGWLSLQHLANRINYFVDEYKARAVTGQQLAAALDAVQHGDASSTQK